jgi:CBS domain-containing protein
LGNISSVSQVMSRNVTTLDTSGTVLDAIRIMTEKGIGCVVVTDKAKPVGIVTERDVMKAMMQGRNVLNSKIAEVMINPVTTVPPEAPVVKALDLMKKKGIRRLPVVSDGKLRGIITVHRDLLYWALPQSKGRIPK